jgi:hypothetical protein
MKHYGIITIAVVLLICASVYGAKVNSIGAAKATVSGETYIVPVNLSNAVPMAALDLPLKFSEGVTLEEVTFEGTRSADFDFKWANIDNDNNTVVIGLIPMIEGRNPDLEPGEGAIANLVFSVDDEEIDKIEVTETTMEKPQHMLMLVYNEVVDGQSQVRSLTPEFDGITVALSQVAAQEIMPKSFALKQNAPNPFNPQTRLDYDIPKATHVRLDVFNVLGQRVITLVDEYQEAGSKSVVWNGRDDVGSSVASGIYFYRLEADQFSATKKMMMLK